MLYVAGDFLDTVFGLAMGKVMDPAGGVQTSILGQFVNVFFTSIFATGCHLTMVRLLPTATRWCRWEPGPYWEGVSCGIS